MRPCSPQRRVWAWPERHENPIPKEARAGERQAKIKILGSYVETTASLQGRHGRRHSRGARRPRPGAPDPPHLAAQGLAVCSRRGRGHRRGATVGAHPTAEHLHAAPHTGEPRPEGADRKRELPWIPPLPPPQPTESALWRVRSRGRSREGWGCGVEWAVKKKKKGVRMRTAFRPTKLPGCGVYGFSITSPSESYVNNNSNYYYFITTTTATIIIIISLSHPNRP